ncbi:MAG: hypothetical protein J6M53_09245 [Bacteroidaceae bacterium]|nr:hypothetical protein [Bacteroidaceae bacterium]
MTTATRNRIHRTPMAPYVSLMEGMSRSDMQVVVTFLQEAIRDKAHRRTAPKAKPVSLANITAPNLRWFIENDLRPDWHTHKNLWDELTDDQRALAERLNLTPDDIDERTFSLLTR